MSTTSADAAHDDAPKKPPPRSGRRPSAVWEFFAAIRTGHNTVHAQCRFCARQCAGVASRMAQHILTKCASAPRAAVDALGGDAAIAAVAKKRKRAGSDDSAPQDGRAAAAAKKKKSASPAPAPAELPPIPAAAATDPNGARGVLADAAVATAQQKLVLACVLNGVPLSFVEDATLMDAFEALAPAFPRVSAERAETEVLRHVHRDVVARIDAALREKQQFAVLHRRLAPGTASTRVDVWTGVDDRREPPILLAEMSSDASLALQQAETVVSAQLARVAPTAVLSVCTESAPLYTQLRELQTERSPAAEDKDKDAADAAEPRLRAVMLGTCMLHETLRLQRKLLQSAPRIMALLQEATMLLYTLAKSTSARVHEALRDVMASAETSRWDLHFRVAHRLLSVEADARAFFQELGAAATTAAPGKTVSSAPPLPRATFWDELRDLHALLAPFAWAFALSECESTTSAQYLLLWLWLLSVVNSSTPSASASLLSADEKDTFAAHIVRVIGARAADHQLASVLLDPRVHGAGLSALGKRKAKALVVRVAERVFAHDAFHVAGTSARASLLAHLGHFAEKTAQFGDAIAWEMSAGNAPQVFWNDYVDDARELAKVARAVLACVPQTQSARAYFAQQQAADPEEPLRVRQIKQFYRKQQPQEPPCRTTDNVAKVYASLLLPLGAPDGSKRHDEPCPAHADDHASHLLVAMAQHMHVLLAVHDDDDPEHDAASQENAETPQQEPPPYTSSESSATESPGSKDPTAPAESDAVELPTPEAPSAAEAAAAAGLAIDASWFAFRSGKERAAIEAAIARFFFSGAAATLAVV